MTNRENNSIKYSVVQFLELELPYEGIANYVCVPHNWIVLPGISRISTEQTVIVAYPTDENSVITRDRVEREERYNDDWKFWMAKLKYQSDTLKDAEEWIATRNGPLILENTSIIDTPSTHPPSSGTESQLNIKPSKQSTTEAAVFNTKNSNAKPGCLSIYEGDKIIDIIEEDLLQNQQPSKNNDNSQNQPDIDMMAAKNYSSTKSIATTLSDQDTCADDSSNNGPSTSRHIPESLSASIRLYDKMKEKPSLNTKHPTIEENLFLENITKNGAVDSKIPSNLVNQSHLRQEAIIFPTCRTSRIVQSEDKSISSQGIGDLARISIERTHHASAIDPRFVLQNGTSVVSSSQNLQNSSQQRLNYAHHLDGQQKLSTPCQHMQHTTRGQELPQRLTYTGRRDPRVRLEHRPIRAAIDTEHPPIGKPTPNFNPTNRTSQFHRLIKVAYKNPTVSYQRGAHQLQCCGRRCVSPRILPRNCRSTPFPQRVIRRPPLPPFTNLPESIRFATCGNFLSHEERLQGSHNQGTPITETHPNVMDYATPGHENVYQNSPIQAQMVEYFSERNQVYLQNDTIRSPHFSDSGVGMDHDVAFGNEIPASEVLVEITNNVNRPRSTSRFVSEQQMLDQFASIPAPIGSTLNNMVNVVDRLRTQILKAAASYKKLVNNVQRFNSPENSISQASLSRNVSQDIPLVVEEIAIAAERANSNGERDSKDFIKEDPERKSYTTSRLTLPPEYDPNDTKWTLKHHEPMPGLVQLLPHSNIYVEYEELNYCERISTDCPSLARRILLLVFNKKALSVCSSMTEKEGVDDNIVPNKRPKLNEHGYLVMLSYILEQGVQRGWKTDIDCMSEILRVLHDKIIKIRSRFGASSC